MPVRFRVLPAARDVREAWAAAGSSGVAEGPSEERSFEIVMDLDELRIGSPVFGKLWSSGAVGTHAESRKTIEHPTAGDVKVDCDVLAVPGSGQHVVAYTAATGSVAADRLDFVRATASLALSLPSNSLRPARDAPTTIGGVH